MTEAEEKKDRESREEGFIPTANSLGPEGEAIGQIGPYKLLRVLGEGGFGVVYLAEQERPVKRRVALKVIKPGMDSKQVIARFEAERQALALLDHPNIASVFNAGTTEAERPYFVMEYVKGVPITEHCDREKLSVEERLKLFVQVCEGIGHAHQKGIIHRDIKPSNVQVVIEGKKAIPKIIDFGVAKAISQPLTEHTLFTEQGQLIGTPEYMSPEQAQMTNQDIDTRSDIYSLGVLLYELLVGALPFDPKTLRRAAFGEIQRIIREQDPPRPSTRLSSLGEEAEKVAKSRRTEVKTLAKRLHKELEWIPLKAMRKERIHRYRSASEFADDIQNYINGTPLIAGPESAAYRIKKFVRRNQTTVTAAAVVAVAVLVGLVVSTVMYFQVEQAHQKEIAARSEAERQAKISEAVNEFLNKDLLASVDPAKAQGREVTVREVLDTASEKIKGKFKDEPLVEASIHQTLGNTYKELGKYKPAELHLERVLTIHREQLGEDHPDTMDSLVKLGRIYLLQDRSEEAETLFIEALESRSRVLGEDNKDTAASMFHLGSLYLYPMWRYDDAEPLLIKALQIQSHMLGEDHPDTLYTMSSLGDLYTVTHRYDEAEKLLVKALDGSLRVFGEEHRRTLECLSDLAYLYIDQERYDEAETLLVKVVQINHRVLGEEHRNTLFSMGNLMRLYIAQGRFNKAEVLFTKALKIRDQLLELGDDYPDVIRYLATLINWMASLQATSPAAELRNGAKSIENATKVCELTNWKNANYVDTLAAAYAEAGDFDSAVKWQKKAIDLLIEEQPAGWRAEFEERLKLYESGKPYRQSP